MEDRKMIERLVSEADMAALADNWLSMVDAIGVLMMLEVPVPLAPAMRIVKAVDDSKKIFNGLSHELKSALSGINVTFPDLKLQ